MFSIFKKKSKNFTIKAPIDGVCKDLSEVPDEVFSEKKMGDGIAIEPTGDLLCAPIDGTITMLIDSHHAFGMTSPEGIEVLVHCGLETVNLKGQGFEVLKNVNEKVKAGEPIIKVDRAFMEKENIPLITPVIVLNPLDKQIVSFHVGEQVKVKDSDILELA